LKQLFSESFEDTLEAASSISSFNNDLLNLKKSSIFLRQSEHQGVARFLEVIVSPKCSNEDLLAAIF